MGLFVNKTSVLAVAILFPLLDTAVVGARIYIRKVRRIRLQADDWTILFALLLLWILSIILIIGAALGSFGGHTAVNPVTGQDVITIKETRVVKLIFAYFLVMVVALGAIKLSVILLYRRIFVGPAFKRFSMVLIFVIGMWCTAFFFSTAFQCGTNIWAWWTNPTTIAEYCDDTPNQELTFAALDIVTDVMVLATPLPLIWKLHLPPIQKVAVCSIFLLGLLSAAAASARLAFFVVGPFETKIGYRDLLAVDTLTVTWGQIEVGVAIIAACLPTLRPLFNHHSPESLIGSIRSKLSLNSLRSSKSSKQSKSESEGANSNTSANYTFGSNVAQVTQIQNSQWDQTGDTTDQNLMRSTIATDEKTDGEAVKS